MSALRRTLQHTANMRAFAVPVLLLAAAHGALAANFDTTIVTGEEVVTSIWETGYCGAIM